MVQRKRTPMAKEPCVSRTLSKLSIGIVAILMVHTAWLAAAQDGAASAPPDALRIKSGVKLLLDLDTPLNTATVRVDDEVWFTSRNDVRIDGRVALFRGTPIRGSVIAVKPAMVNGKNQRTELQIRLEEIPLAEGGSLAIAAGVLKIQGEKAGSVSGSVAQNTVGQATQGAMMGGMIGRSAKAAGIGAVAAVGVGIIGSVLQARGPSSDVDLPAGSIFEAKLERPLDIPDPAMLAKAVPRPPASATPDSAPASIGDLAVVADASLPGTPESNDASGRSLPALGDLGETNPESVSATPSPDSGPLPATINPASLSVDVNLVQVDAMVRDRTGKPLSNLRQDDFRIIEDGVEQRIQFFSRDQLPLAVALVIDRSGSVAPLMSQVQTAAYQALRLLKAGDEVCLFTFAGSVEMLEELTTNRQRVANRIGGIHAGGGTAIVDAVSEALRYLEAAAPDRRGAVILISDNAEGRSTVRVDDVIEYALESEAVIYSVKVGNGAGGLFGLPGVPGLPTPRFPGLGSGDPVKEITKETGGEIFDATGGSSIAAALTMAVDRLKLRYTLSYASGNTARTAKGGYHRIQVQLVPRFGRPDTDYTVLSRSGYYDPPSKTNSAAARP